MTDKEEKLVEKFAEELFLPELLEIKSGMDNLKSENGCR